ncbi:MAG: hypothetical protein ACREUU_07395 [Gammaproteobacteria bacterium]
MKRQHLSALVLPALMFCAAAAGAEEGSVSGELAAKCAAPGRPEIPNGRTATEEEMLSAQKALKSYLADGDTYIGCVDALEQSLGEEPTDEQRSVVLIFHNRMVDEMQATADLFNQAVRAFKGKRGE